MFLASTWHNDGDFSSGRSVIPSLIEMRSVDCLESQRYLFVISNTFGGSEECDVIWVFDTMQEALKVE